MKLHRILFLLPLLVLLSVVGQAFSAVTPASFVRPPSNYEPMNIYIRAYNFMGLVPLKDDKIGVFDVKGSGDTLCVGVVQMTKNFSEYLPNEFIILRAYKEYVENGVVVDRGFTEGHTIKYYHLVAATQEVVAIPDSNVIYFSTLPPGAQLANPVTYLGRGTALAEVYSGSAKLTLNVTPAGVGQTIPAADEYLYDVGDAEVVTIQVNNAATQQHYEFSHWTVDGVDDPAASAQVTMDENHVVTANFKLKKYTLTPTMQPNVGDIIPAAATQYDALTWVDIFAKPAEGSGYKFSRWEATPANAEVEDLNQAGTRVKMNSDVSMRAIFALEQDSLTIEVTPATAGTTSPAAGVLHQYSFGTSVPLTATPATGYVFKHWAEHLTSPKDTLIVLSTSASYNLLIEANRNVHAVFEKQMFTLGLQSDALLGDIYIKLPGDVNPTKANAQYTLEHGTQVILYAFSTDANKYPFANWSGSITGTDNPVTVSMQNNMAIVANFEDTTPVELASFSVVYAPNSVSRALMLKWQTASETNNLGFDIERAIGSATNWQKIGFVEGHGTTADVKFYEFIDEDATTEGSYFYRLKQNDTNGAYAYSQTVQFDVTAPQEFGLAQNYPNPFNPSTQIVFQLKEDIRVSLAVYDLLGRQVATVVNQEMKAGTHKITFDANELSAGVYFYSLTAGSFHQMKKMTLIK